LTQSLLDKALIVSQSDYKNTLLDASVLIANSIAAWWRNHSLAM